MVLEINEDYSSYEYIKETYDLVKKYKKEWESGKVSREENRKRLSEVGVRLKLQHPPLNIQTNS